MPTDHEVLLLLRGNRGVRQQEKPAEYGQYEAREGCFLMFSALEAPKKRTGSRLPSSNNGPPSSNNAVGSCFLLAHVASV